MMNDNLKLFLVIIYDLVIIVGSLWLAIFWNHWCWFLLLTWPILIRTPYWVEKTKENENVTVSK